MSLLKKIDSIQTRANQISISEELKISQNERQKDFNKTLKILGGEITKSVKRLTSDLASDESHMMTHEDSTSRANKESISRLEKLYPINS